MEVAEITIDIRYIGLGFLVIAILLITIAFVSLIRTNNALRKRIREYEERDNRDRSYERYTSRPYEGLSDNLHGDTNKSPSWAYPEDKFGQVLQNDIYGAKPKQQDAGYTPMQNVRGEDDFDRELEEWLNTEPTFDGEDTQRPIINERNQTTYEPKTLQSAAGSIPRSRSFESSGLNAEKANLKQLKQLLKSPISSAEDAAMRKKVFTRYLWIIIGCIVVFSVLMNLKIPVLSSIATILGLISFLLLFAVILLLVTIRKSAKAFSEITCATCKHQITYGDNVHYTILDVSNRLYANDRNANLKEYVNVRFDCVCQNCGAEKIFIHAFCTSNITASGNENISAVGYEHLLEKQIRDYFDGKVTVVA